MSLVNQAIQTIEELEQEVFALKNEQPVESEFFALKHQIQEAEKIITIISAERNTLSQVVRIQASHGRIDPVQETFEKEMIQELNDKETL